MTKKLVHILPFMEDEDIKDLAIKVINKEVTGVKLVMLFPFLKQSDLEEIVEELIAVNDGKNLSRALPFVKTEMVNRIYEGVKDGSITGVKETYLYPFLGKNQLKSMFDELVKEAMENKDSDTDLEVEIETDEEELHVHINEEE